MKSLSFGGSFSEIPALRNRLDTKELCVTLIPLLRIMLEISDHKLPGSNTDLALQSIAHLRHRMISLFGEKSSLSSDTHPQSENDLLENEMTFNLSHPLNSNPVHTIVNEILLMDDIEEY